MTEEVEYITYIAGGIVGLIILVWFIRFVNGIARRNRYMEAQIWLLIKIAEKQGVSREEISQIESIYKDLPTVTTRLH